jgi:hypothetical protein
MVAPANVPAICTDLSALPECSTGAYVSVAPATAHETTEQNLSPDFCIAATE